MRNTHTIARKKSSPHYVAGATAAFGESKMSFDRMSICRRLIVFLFIYLLWSMGSTQLLFVYLRMTMEGEGVLMYVFIAEALQFFITNITNSFSFRFTTSHFVYQRKIIMHHYWCRCYSSKVY